jgi:hypothetical protein
MIDLYLKFKDAMEASSVLFTGDENNFKNIDIIGTIYKPTGQVIVTDFGDQPMMAEVPGYHVNVRLNDDEDGTALEPYSIVVNNPVRVWA